jgi:hypothetical protein
MSYEAGQLVQIRHGGKGSITAEVMKVRPRGKKVWYELDSPCFPIPLCVSESTLNKINIEKQTFVP